MTTLKPTRRDEGIFSHTRGRRTLAGHLVGHLGKDGMQNEECGWLYSFYLVFFYSLIIVDLWFGLFFILSSHPHTHALSSPLLSSSLDFHRVIRNRRLRDSACVRACVIELGGGESFSVGVLLYLCMCICVVGSVSVSRSVSVRAASKYRCRIISSSLWPSLCSVPTSDRAGWLRGPYQRLSLKTLHVHAVRVLLCPMCSLPGGTAGIGASAVCRFCCSVM